VYATEVDVRVKVSSTEIVVSVSQDYVGLTCGLCGDFNGEEEYVYNFPGPDGEPIPLELAANAYTLH
jgi:hypothetical protein